MHYLIFIGAFLWFAFIAPVKVTLATLAVLLLTVAAVRASVRWLGGVDASFGETVKGVGLSFFFVMLAVVFIISFAVGNQHWQFHGTDALLVLGVFFFAYLLGFKVAMGTSVLVSGVAAVVAAVVGTVSVLAVQPLL